jgi:hypothetical protein
VNERIGVFTPISSITAGQVFTPKQSALLDLKLKYTARPHRNVSAALEGTYFIRTDGETLTGADYPPSTARCLGGEVYASALWAPASDVMLTIGGGAFFPQWGNVFDPGSAIRWKASAGLTVSW